MRKRLFALTALLSLMVAGQAVAQQRKAVPTTAAYQVGFRSLCVHPEYIFYLENSQNNAVMGIERNTGEVKTIVPGIAKVYEDARPEIKSIACHASRLFLYMYDRVYIYDWKSDKPWIPVNEAVNVLACNDKYMLYRKKDDSLWLEDWTTGTIVKRHDTTLTFDDGTYIASNGDVWFKSGNIYGHAGVSRLKPQGKIEFCDMWNLDYMGKTHGNISRMVQKGDSLYMSCGRRLYRLDMLSDGHIEEYAKVPPTDDNVFGRFGINSKGDILTDGKHAAWYVAGNFEAPRNLGKNVPTGLSTFDFTEIWLSLSAIRTDADDNFIIYRRDASKIFTYNPNGVKGYALARGKVIKK